MIAQRTDLQYNSPRVENGEITKTTLFDCEVVPKVRSALKKVEKSVKNQVRQPGESDIIEQLCAARRSTGHIEEREDARIVTLAKNIEPEKGIRAKEDQEEKKVEHKVKKPQKRLNLYEDYERIEEEMVLNPKSPLPPLDRLSLAAIDASCSPKLNYLVELIKSRPNDKVRLLKNWPSSNIITRKSPVSGHGAAAQYNLLHCHCKY